MKAQAWQGYLATLVPRQKLPPSSRFRPLRASLKACIAGQWLRSEDLMTLTVTKDPGTLQYSISIVNNHVYERHALKGVKIILPKFQSVNFPADTCIETGQTALFMTQEGIFAFKFLNKASVSAFLQAVKEISEAAQVATSQPVVPVASQPQAHAVPAAVSESENPKKIASATKPSQQRLPLALHNRVQDVLKDPTFPDFLKQIEQAWALSSAISPALT